MALMTRPLRAAFASIHGLKYTSFVVRNLQTEETVQRYEERTVNLGAEGCLMFCVSLSKYDAKLIA